MIITREQLQAIVPKIKPAALETFLPHLQSLLPKYTIDTQQRLGGFIAQVAHESANFSAVREFGSGNAYEGRKDLGNTEPGDGPRFKGRGLIQVTGRGNYKWFSKDIFGDARAVDNPELLTTPANAVLSACWYWTKVKPLNVVCDRPEDWTFVWNHNRKTYTKIMWMTLLINGGQNGIDERTANYQRAREVLNF